MKKNNFIKYYRVYKNDTSVTEVSVNDFKPVLPGRFKRGIPIAGPGDAHCPLPCFEYSLPPDGSMFFGYPDKVTAMEKAKAGALAYINEMIKEVELGIKKLVQYRNDHYEDLNINLLDANIRRLKKEMYIK
ncbi:hypothetical protein R1T15_25250 [Mucilaginibacter sp. L3T2-6]|uniref:Uncharacterized protein n=1 Tax=Mucilaginibacter mali TaxID=2740462 RepID=A0A7D4Q3H4_9SPHI|nr:MULTISPECIES: hypothetical protein [Mucilaginibacter]MDV6217845.1 hypothetical protein [Mucilaginibacter sp. L3T2-6]QKJ30287.1 hypothetical protein HQ865_11105 [Mucilaginibacter mali]